MQAGADHSCRDWLQQTALLYATTFGHAVMARILLYFGACPFQADASGRLPLHIAIEKKHRSTAEVLLRHVGVEHMLLIDRLGHTFLHKVRILTIN